MIGYAQALEDANEEGAHICWGARVRIDRAQGFYSLTPRQESWYSLHAWQPQPVKREHSQLIGDFLYKKLHKDILPTAQKEVLRLIACGAFSEADKGSFEDDFFLFEDSKATCVACARGSKTDLHLLVWFLP